MRIKSLLAAILALSVGLSYIACSTTAPVAYPSLADAGILSLSTTNPYLGSNLFISHEAERSPYFFNFLKGRGAPVAIELLAEGYSNPRLLLFYPREKEVYFAEPQMVGEVQEWITRGPFAIEWRDLRTLAQLDTSMAGEPVFMIAGREYRFRFNRPERKEKVLEPVVPVTPMPTLSPKPKAKPIVKKGEPKKEPAEDYSISNYKPMNSDQMAIYMSKGFAERADNGDVLHTVKSDKETIEAITRWYTGAPKDAKAIAELNGFKEEDGPTKALEPGKKIRIPVSMLKQLKAMP